MDKDTLLVLLALVRWLLPLVYMALVIDYGATFILRVRTHARNPGVLAVILLHALYLVLRGMYLGGLPLATNPEVLSLVAISSTIVYWAIERFTRDRRAGVFVFMLVFLCQYTASQLLAASSGGTASGIGRLHIIPACLAYTAMGFAALYALLYLLGRRNLKQHHFGLLFDRLPPLDLLGRMSWQALLVGLGFMTVAMITGAMMFSHASSDQALGTKVAAKIVIGSTAWLTCAVAVGGRWMAKWSLKRVTAIALAGFVVVVTLLVTSIAMS